MEIFPEFMALEKSVSVPELIGGNDRPHPDPLPWGEGTASHALFLVPQFVPPTQPRVFACGRNEFSLAPRERAGVRGKAAHSFLA